MKNEKGITMLVLVVTIVILLVISGVTISYVMGKDGTISQAAIASFESEVDQIMELIAEKQDLLNLEGETIASPLSDSDKQSILSDRYDVEDKNKKVMDIEAKYQNGELVLTLKYKEKAFNKKQIEILNEKGAKKM